MAEGFCAVLLEWFHHTPECLCDYLHLLGQKRAQVHDEMIGFDSPYDGRIVSAKEFLDLIRAEIAGLDCHNKSGQVLGGKRTTAHL